MAFLANAANGEPVDRVAVTVSFLRMDEPPRDPTPALPPGVEIHLRRDCTVEYYRWLYASVGNDYLWWLRRTMPDDQLAGLLRDSRTAIYEIFRDGVSGGFYELDSTPWPVINLSYFGLMPHMVGAGVGYAFLRHAVDSVWRSGARLLTVNTCTADHPRALPTYMRAGFKLHRVVREEWNIPKRLGLPIPDVLRI